MKQRIIKNRYDRENAIAKIMGIEFPYVLAVGPEKLRTEAANARYWATLDEYLDEIRIAVERVSEATGYTPLEVRKIISISMTPEHAVILWALKKDAVHDALKLVCDIPTSTKLGTKEFQKFEQIMETTLADVLADVNNFMGRIG